MSRILARLPTRYSLPALLLALAVVLYAAYFGYLTIQRYQGFEARALDLGNLNQATWNTAHGNWFRLTNQQPEVTNRLSLHVEPILLLIAPLYRLFPTVETLLVLQAAVVALGALPLYALARQQRLSAWLALAFGVAYLLNPTIQAANWLEFHPVTLVPTFLIAAFYFLIVSRTGWFALFALLAAACKEEIGLLVGMLGLYAWLVLGRRRLGLVTLLLAAGWSLLAVFGIQAMMAGGNIHWGRYAYLGATTGDKLRALILRPYLVLAQVRQAEPLRYFFELLLPVGFTALLAPEVLLLALPSLAINLLADFAPMHQVTTLIYAAPVVPFVMVAGVMGVARAGRILTRRRGDAEKSRVGWAWVAGATVLGGAVVAQVLFGYLPGVGNHLAVEVTDHHRRAQAIIEQIPDGASVSAQDRLNPHVSGRETVYIFPRVEEADYVFLDVTGPAWPQHPADLKRSVDDLLATGYGIAAADDGYLLLARTAPTTTLPASFYTPWTRSSNHPITQSPNHPITQSLVFSDSLHLLAYTVTTDRYGELVVDMAWQATEPIDEDVRFFLGYYDRDLTLLHDSQFYQPSAVLWYPTSMWTPGVTVHVRSLPWKLDADEFVLVLGVYAGEDGWTTGARLPVSAAEPVVPLLEAGTLARLGGFVRGEDGSWQAMPAPPAAERVLDARLGDAIRLDGVTLPAQGKAGATLPFRLDWHTTAPLAVDYSAFVHLLDSDGNKVQQLDWTPHDAVSKLPTTNWPVDWPVEDSQALALPLELAPGDYTLIAGLYDWQSGARLPVTGADAVPGDAVLLGRLRIE